MCKCKKENDSTHSKLKKGSPLSDGHVSGRHHVAQFVFELRLKQAGCVSAAVCLRVCRWRLTHSPGWTRCCSGCYHSGLRQLCEHKQTSTHKWVSKINNMTAATQMLTRFPGWIRFKMPSFFCLGKAYVNKKRCETGFKTHSANWSIYQALDKNRML